MASSEKRENIERKLSKHGIGEQKNEKKKNAQTIADLLYEEIGYMYCDNCRFNSEIKEEDTDEWGCDECHRKYNGWGISRAESERIAKKIVKEVE